MCTVLNLLLIVLLNKRRFPASKTRFLAISIDFWTRIPVYFEATNSGILLQHSNMINTTFCTAMNLLLIILLNKTRFTVPKTRFLAFSIDFWTRIPVYFEVTNLGILLQHSNVLETTFCTVMNLFTILRNKTPFTASKTLIIPNSKKLQNSGDDQVPTMGAILFSGFGT